MVFSPTPVPILRCPLPGDVASSLALLVSPLAFPQQPPDPPYSRLCGTLHFQELQWSHQCWVLYPQSPTASCPEWCLPRMRIPLPALMSSTTSSPMRQVLAQA